MTKRICILSAEIHSGKTSAIDKWINERNSVLGFICPDIDGKRFLKDLRNGELHSFQTDHFVNGRTVEIGKYIFDKTAFAEAETIIEKAVELNPEWIVMDEIGKLELQGNGWENALVFLLQNLNRIDSKVLLVIRDYLLEEAVIHFDLPEHSVIGIPALNELK